jgi:hypothetical protein
MRYALISDIHANLPALKAVLDEIAGRDVDETYHLGDLVGYASLLRRVTSAERTSTRGHDRPLVGAPVSGSRRRAVRVSAVRGSRRSRVHAALAARPSRRLGRDGARALVRPGVRSGGWLFGAARVRHHGVATDERAPATAAPFALGATVFAGALVTGPLTGGSFNPARSLGRRSQGAGGRLTGCIGLRRSRGWLWRCSSTSAYGRRPHRRFRGMYRSAWRGQ